MVVAIIPGNLLNHQNVMEAARQGFSLHNDVVHKKTHAARAQANSTTILPTFCPWKRPMKAPTALSIPFATVSLCFTLPAFK